MDHLSTISDAELIARLKSRDKAAFDVVYQRYWLKLYRVASHIVEDNAVAEDITQDAFVSFWEKASLQEIRNIEAYLYQMVKYRCFMHLRSGLISRKHLDRFASVLSNTVNIDFEFEARELEEVVEQAIASLPEKCREVYQLSRVEQLPNKKIAEKLHISPKTVENQITKALRHLRLSLDKLAVLLFLIQ
jgi:RNA polymerase sigma-70 factor (ECF subfamily)